MSAGHTLSADRDNEAVDQFAALMKAKLAAARARGRHGWQTCPVDTLQHMLIEHVHKGDPVDVANFCMFLSARAQITTLDEQAIYDATGLWPGVAAGNRHELRCREAANALRLAASRLLTRGHFEAVSCADAATRVDLAEMRAATLMANQLAKEGGAA